MPVRYTFSGNLFRMDMEGSYALEDISRTFLAALSDPLFPDDARFLFDVSRSSELAHRTNLEVRRVAEFLAEHSERVGRRCAVVASDPVHYGLSRLGAAYAELSGAEVRVFADIDDAVSWLGADIDVGVE